MNKRREAVTGTHVTLDISEYALVMMDRRWRAPRSHRGRISMKAPLLGVLAASLFWILLAGHTAANAQSLAAKPAPAATDQPAQPAPRLPDGKVDLGGKGVWAPIWVLDWASKKYVEENIDVPFTPAGLQLYNERQANHSKDDPEG